MALRIAPRGAVEDHAALAFLPRRRPGRTAGRAASCRCPSPRRRPSACREAGRRRAMRRGPERRSIAACSAAAHFPPPRRRRRDWERSAHSCDSENWSSVPSWKTSFAQDTPQCPSLGPAVLGKVLATSRRSVVDHFESRKSGVAPLQTRVGRGWGGPAVTSSFVLARRIAKLPLQLRQRLPRDHAAIKRVQPRHQPRRGLRRPWPLLGT